MPPTSAPYNLTVIEGIVLDIRGNNPHVSINEISDHKKNIEIFYHQNNQITVVNHSSSGLKPEVFVFDRLGRLILQTSVNLAGEGERCNIALPPLSKGMFIVKASLGSKGSESFKFVKID